MPRAKVLPKPGLGGADTGRAAFEQGQSQGATDDLRRQLATCPFISGKLIRAVAIQSGGSKKIAHGLGFVPRGVINVNPRSGTSFPTIITSGTDRQFITLFNFGTDAILADFWVW